MGFSLCKAKRTHENEKCKKCTDLSVGERHMRAENRFYSSNHPIKDKIWNVVASIISTITSRLPLKQPNQFASYTESFSSFIPFIRLWKIQFRFKSIRAICLKIYDLRLHVNRITDTFRPFKRFHWCWNDFAVFIRFGEGVKKTICWCVCGSFDRLAEKSGRSLNVFSWLK